jgi:hypothetical protein
VSKRRKLNLDRLRKAESPHKRQYWRMRRENAAAVGMWVEQVSDSWNVIGPKGMCAGPFITNAEAWRWLDNHTKAKRYGAGDNEAA